MLVIILQWTVEHFLKDPWNSDTMLLRTDLGGPRVSVLDVFHCAYQREQDTDFVHFLTIIIATLAAVARCRWQQASSLSAYSEMKLLLRCWERVQLRALSVGKINEMLYDLTSLPTCLYSSTENRPEATAVDIWKCSVIGTILLTLISTWEVFIQHPLYNLGYVSW